MLGMRLTIAGSFATALALTVSAAAQTPSAPAPGAAAATGAQPPSDKAAGGAFATDETYKMKDGGMYQPPAVRPASPAQDYKVYNRT